MPSQNQPADTSARMRCPNLREQIGEDPARWLDGDLLADDDRAAMVKTLIDGIDSYQRLRAWRAVERKLAARDDRDPRAAVMQRLDQREEWLDLNGERSDRMPEDIDKSCDCCDADGFVTAADLRERREAEWSRRSEGYSPDGVDTTETSPETEQGGLEAFADGGELE